jgi:hypothetical protein
MSNQNFGSHSFSMSHISHDECIDRPIHQISNLKNFATQVRRPDENNVQNVLQFLEFE